MIEGNWKYQIVRLVKTGKSPWELKLVGKIGATRKFIIVIGLGEEETCKLTQIARSCQREISGGAERLVERQVAVKPCI